MNYMPRQVRNVEDGPEAGTIMFFRLFPDGATRSQITALRDSVENLKRVTRRIYYVAYQRGVDSVVSGTTR